MSFLRTATERGRRGTSPRKRHLLPMLLGALVLVVAAPAMAEESVLERPWRLDLGGYITDFSTDANVGAGGAFGTFIRAENQLGVDSSQSAVRFDGRYRFNQRHAIKFGYWGTSREGLQELDDQIEFNEVVYDVGARLASKIELDYFRVAWAYTLIREERGEAGFTLGLSTFDFFFEVAGEGEISGETGSDSGFFRESEDLLAPAPTLGVFLSYSILPRLIVRGEANFLDIELGDLEATLLETLLAVDWYFTEHIGIGVGTLATSIDYKDTGDDPLQIDYRQKGFFAYVTAIF